MQRAWIGTRIWPMQEAPAGIYRNPAVLVDSRLSGVVGLTRLPALAMGGSAAVMPPMFYRTSYPSEAFGPGWLCAGHPDPTTRSVASDSPKKAGSSLRRACCIARYGATAINICIYIHIYIYNKTKPKTKPSKQKSLPLSRLLALLIQLLLRLL